MDIRPLERYETSSHKVPTNFFRGNLKDKETPIRVLKTQFRKQVCCTDN